MKFPAFIQKNKHPLFALIIIAMVFRLVFVSMFVWSVAYYYTRFEKLHELTHTQNDTINGVLLLVYAAGGSFLLVPQLFRRSK